MAKRLAVTNVAPAQSLFLDDYPANIAAAEALGMQTILVGADPQKTVNDITALLG